MAESDITTGVRQLFDVASDLETNQDALRIMLDLTNSLSCNWSVTDGAETVGNMVERVIVMTNCALDKIRAIEELVEQLYKIDFESKQHEATA
jgi:hypothetical protein